MSRERCPTCKRALAKPIPKIRNKARRGPMRSPAYRRWCREQPCVILMALDYDDDRSDVCVEQADRLFNVCDPAHTENNGMRSKGPDSSCVPLCRKHHIEYDSNRAAFERKYNANMRQIAKEHYERFLRETGTVHSA